MPKGKFLNHKGRNRKFTSPEELEEQRKQEEEKRRWRAQHGGESSSDEDAAKEKNKSGSDSEESSSEDETPSKAKGVSGLIEVENPNRVVKKNKKLTNLGDLEVPAKPELSRREREEIEKQNAAAAYQRLHAAGKTEQARADLARLALVRQQREEAAKRRESDKKAKEESTTKGKRT